MAVLAILICNFKMVINYLNINNMKYVLEIYNDNIISFYWIFPIVSVDERGIKILFKIRIIKQLKYIRKNIVKLYLTQTYRSVTIYKDSYTLFR